MPDKNKTLFGSSRLPASGFNILFTVGKEIGSMGTVFTQRSTQAYGLILWTSPITSRVVVSREQEETSDRPRFSLDLTHTYTHTHVVM